MRAQQTWSTPVRKETALAIPCAVCGGTRFTPAFACEGFAYVRCAACNLAQINPQPIAREVQSRYGADYLRYERANEEAFFELGRLAMEDARIGAIEAASRAAGNRRALEVGCATGALLAWLRERGWEVEGVEISAEEAAYAREKRGLTISTQTLEETRFPDAHFFLINASHLIEHLNDPASFVREARRILAPGGRFLVTTPNIDGFQARLFANRWRSAIFDHLYLFSKKTLTRLLCGAGFTVERIVTWGGIARGFAPPAVKGLADRAAKRFGFGDVMLAVCRSERGM